MDFQVEARSRNFAVPKTSVADVGRTLPTVRLILDAYRFYSLFGIYDASFCFFLCLKNGFTSPLFALFIISANSNIRSIRKHNRSSYPLD